jgi:hypothetical protein
MAVTAAWGYVLLNRTPDWHPGLRVAVLVVGFAAAAALALPTLSARVASAVAVAAVAAGLAGPIAYSLDTASTAKSGSIVAAGPASFTGPGGFGRAGGRTNQNFPGTPPGGFGFRGGFGGQTGQPNGTPGGFRGGFGGGAGGLLEGSRPSAQMVTLLQQNSAAYTWVAAAVGSNSASGYQLATGKPVMPIGGFNGSDPSPTLAQFQDYVRAGKIHYFLGGGRRFGGFGGSSGGSNASSQIAAWVAANYQAQTVGGTTVYDLTAPTS